MSSFLFCLFLLPAFVNPGFSQAPAKVFPGADEKTPARSQYFSWINNTGEGSTEGQTLSNLSFFQWLRNEYGMILDIYAFDAGNIDKSEYFGSGRDSKFEKQFPRGFKPIADQAAVMGTRLGIWDAPDRFGNTPQEEEKQTEYMVSLCRDYHFELFKFDAMGGDLRDEKQDAFIRMMTECRKYSPDLILLNHGVCLSSCLDYWEDDLILQAFNRNLILAPEIYGNPWLLRDDEYPKLAAIYNLARKYKEILVNGIILPEEKYGEKAVSHGDSQTRLITLRNMTWLPVQRTIKLDEEVGLSKGSMVELRQFHPMERMMGRFKKGQTVTVEVLPFRSCLLIASSEKFIGPAIDGCDYEVVKDLFGKPLQINLLGFPGEKKTVVLKGLNQTKGTLTIDGKLGNYLLNGQPVEVVFPGVLLKEKYHRKLCDLKSVPVPADAEALYEATCFAADNNALEVRSLVRSGPTAIPEVQKARDAFFNQTVFIDRGLWDRYLFDGDRNTAFYPGRRWGRREVRINGGSLRLDMGRPTRLDSLRFIIGDEQALQPFKSWEAIRIEVSSDLKNWKPVLMLAGKEMTLLTDPSELIRYVRLPGSPERVIEIEGYLNGKPVDRTGRKLPGYCTQRQAWRRGCLCRHPYMAGAKIKAVVLVAKNGLSEFKPEVWIMAYPVPYEKISVEVK